MSTLGEGYVGAVWANGGNRDREVYENGDGDGDGDSGWEFR